MKHVTKTLFSATVAAGLIGSAQAATITALGSENSTGPDWRTTSVVKSSTFDPNGDNAYGSDGYYLGEGSGSTPNVLQLLPSYVSGVSTSGAFWAGGAYIDLDDPSQPIDTSVTNVNAGLYYNTGTKISFTVSSAQRFVLTVIIGGEQGRNAPPDVTLVQTAGSGSGSDSVTGLANVVGTYVFFDVDAAAGDSFDVNLPSASSTQGVSGIAFETVPEPSSLALMGLGGLCVLRRRRA